VQDFSTSSPTWRDAWQEAKMHLHHLWQHWQKNSSRRHKFILLLLMVIGIVMRLQFLNQPIRTDEALTYLQYASGSLLQPLYDYSAPNNHILHTLGVSFTTRLLGNAEWTIRLITFISGSLLVLTTYIAGSLLIQRRSALIGAGLVAISATLIAYATNARGYMLQANFWLLSVIFLSLWQMKQNRFYWLGFVITSALGFYTIPTMLYAFAGTMLWWLLACWQQAKRQQALLWWFSAGVAVTGLTLLLYTPIFIVSGIGAIVGNIYVAPQSWQELVALWETMLRDIWQQWHTDIDVVVQMLLFGGFLLGLRLERQKTIPLAIAVIFALGLILIIQRVAPFTRVFLLFLPIYCIYVGAGWHWLAERIFKGHGHSIAVGIALILVGVQSVVITLSQSPYWTLETGTMRDAESIIRDYGTRLSEDAQLIFQHPSGESLRYYARRYDVRAEYVIRNYLPEETLYVVVNHEYQHSIASVFRENTLFIQDYDLQSVQHYSLASVYHYSKREPIGD
jgi:predicted membrane-bound mannosyltransferase